MAQCSSGKRMFFTQQQAEDALLELWSKHEYVESHAPITTYRCEDCGQFHFTSKGTMSERLSEAISSGKIKRQREANKWLDKFKDR